MLALAAGWPSSKRSRRVPHTSVRRLERVVKGRSLTCMHKQHDIVHTLKHAARGCKPDAIPFN